MPLNALSVLQFGFPDLILQLFNVLWDFSRRLVEMELGRHLGFGLRQGVYGVV